MPTIESSYLDKVEARFLAIQRERFADWFQNEDRVRNHIVDLMRIQQEVYGDCSWKTFMKTGAYKRLIEYASPTCIYRFNIIWVDIRTRVDKGIKNDEL